MSSNEMYNNRRIHGKGNL